MRSVAESTDETDPMSNFTNVRMSCQRFVISTLLEP
jgi:hypothetical protein